MNVLVTGATGFVGGAIVARATRDGQHHVRAAVRRALSLSVPAGAESVVVGDLKAQTDWTEAVSGIDAVVHAAARVHVMHATEGDSLTEFRRVNVEGTLHLARQAAEARVKRFVFISSVKVHGDETEPGAPFRADSAPHPTDAYGASKREAEDLLFSLASETGLEVVVIRPVLVYGPGVRANFLAMMRWVKRGIPLPFASIDNRRSLVAVENLADLVVRCLSHPAAANAAFLASDGEDISTPELLRRLAGHMGRHARLFSVPPRLLGIVLAAAGRGAEGRRLCSSLQVDIGTTRKLLDWNPPVGADDAMARTVAHFLRSADKA